MHKASQSIDSTDLFFDVRASIGAATAATGRPRWRPASTSMRVRNSRFDAS